MNPAQHLLHIYDLLVARHPEQSMILVWATVFDLDLNSPSLDDEVTDCLMALRSQLDFTKRLLVERYEVPENLLEPGFGGLRSVASPSNMQQPVSLRASVQPKEHRQAFAWGCWVLRNELEDEMPPETMRELLEELESLRGALRNADLSDYLREFIQRQIDAIGSALRLYKVQGARPMAEALRKVAGDMVTSKDQLQKEAEAAPEEAKGVLSRAASLINRTASVCDDLDKIKKAGESAVSIAATVGPLVLSFVSRLLGP